MKSFPEPGLQKILQLYVPECRHLHKAEFEFPYSVGEFKIKSAFCNASDSKYLSAAEILICADQLAYVAMAGWLGEKKLPFACSSMSEYLNLAKNSTFTKSVIRYSQPIALPANFLVKMEAGMMFHDPDRLFVVGLNYDFGMGRAVGGLELTLQFPPKNPPPLPKQ